MDKPLVWLRGEVKTPPFGAAARIEAGFLLRRPPQRESLSLPHSRPMPGIGPRCHELRIIDGDHTWRLVDHVESDAVVILDVFPEEDAGDTAGDDRDMSAAVETVPADVGAQRVMP